jgi:ABC-type transport system involved in multi-copper enzyme maturation permease subunit
MVTTQITLEKQAATGSLMHPLRSVMSWELRRLRSSRLTWGITLGAFILFLVILWTERNKYSIGAADTLHGYTFSGTVAEASTLGFLLVVPGSVLLLFGLLLPFVSGDGVARDLSRRTHELLMATTLPTWAYVWGRYLVGLLLSLGLATLMLVAVVACGVVQHLTVANCPVPQVGDILALWGALVIPVTFLVSGVSFGLATLLPRYATMVKLATLACWFVAGVALPEVPDQQNIPAWYAHWDPSGAVLSRVTASQFTHALQSDLNAAVRGHSVLQLLLRLELQMPDVGVWLVPHLMWAGLGLAVVVIAAVSFRRFRGASR